MFKEKIELIRDEARRRDDSLLLDELDGFVRSCQAYQEKVVSMERIMTLQRFRLDPEEYRVKVQEIDTARKIAHDALIARVSLVNRISQMFGLGAFLDIEALTAQNNLTEREVVARMAGQVVDEYFEAGLRAKTE